jgi:hypothetical protein
MNTLGEALGTQYAAIPRQLNHGQDGVVRHFADSQHLKVLLGSTPGDRWEMPSKTLDERDLGEKPTGMYIRQVFEGISPVTIDSSWLITLYSTMLVLFVRISTFAAEVSSLATLVQNARYARRDDQPPARYPAAARY